jgi:flagellar hook assembly protein FlgD
LPEGYSLAQNYPNPFNGGTRISFVLPRTENVKLNIYDILGAKVAMLFDGWAQAGETVLYWDGNRIDNSEASSGVYFYRLERTLGGSFTNKMILAK